MTPLARLICWIRGHRRLNRLACAVNGRTPTCSRCGKEFPEMVEIDGYQLPPEMYAEMQRLKIGRTSYSWFRNQAFNPTERPDEPIKEKLDRLCNEIANKPKSNYCVIVPNDVWDDSDPTKPEER